MFCSFFQAWRKGWPLITLEDDPSLFSLEGEELHLIPPLPVLSDVSSNCSSVTVINTVHTINNKKEKTIAFQESITDTQQLSVKLQIYYPEKKNDLCYEVIKWKKEAVGAWKKDDFLPVYRNK